MSAAAAISSVICAYIPTDLRTGITVGAAGGALVGGYVVQYLGSLSTSTSKQTESFPCEKQVVIAGKALIVTTFTLTGGALGFVYHLKF